ncbi:MAG: RyR domain-containing protein [Magnetococcus sp. YQC-9]
MIPIWFPMFIVCASLGLLFALLAITAYTYLHQFPPPLWGDDLMGLEDALHESLRLVFGSFFTPLRENNPWPSRWSLPATLAVTLSCILWRVSRNSLRVWWIGRNGGHVIIWGEHTFVVPLLNHFVAPGSHQPLLLVVEESPKPLESKALGRPVGQLIGHPRQEALLRRCRLDNATACILASGNDQDNIQVARLIKAWLHTRPRPVHQPLLISVRVTDTRVRDQFASGMEPLGNSLRLHPFSHEYLAARQMFHDHPPDRFRYLAKPHLRHLLLVGFGRLGRQVLFQFLRMANFQDHTPPMATIIDREALFLGEGFHQEYQEMREIGQISCRFVPMDTDNTTTWRLFLDSISASETPPTLICICHGPERSDTALAVATEQHLRLRGFFSPPILVPVQAEEELHHHLAADPEGFMGSGAIRPFGSAKSLLTREMLLRQQLDILAQFIHEIYRQQRQQEGKLEPDKESHRSWEALPEFYKDGNRNQADHLRIKLRDCGYRMGTSGQTSGSWPPSNAIVEKLAWAEHDRWRIVYWLDGWRSGQTSKKQEFIEKNNPYLRPYEELDEATKEFDRKPILNLPALLNQSGTPLLQDLLIVVCDDSPDGHTLATGADQAVEAFFHQLRNHHPGRALVLLSPLHTAHCRRVITIALGMELPLQLMLTEPIPALLRRLPDPKERNQVLTALSQAERLDVAGSSQTVGTPLMHQGDARIVIGLQAPPDTGSLLFLPAIPTPLHSEAGANHA